MSFGVDIIKDRVQQNVVVGGLGNVIFNGSGAVSGFNRFGDVMTIGQTTWIFIYDPTAFVWEIDKATYASGDQLQRTKVIDSSSGGAPINFPGNACQIAMTIPAQFVADPGSGSTYEYGTVSFGAGSVAQNGTIVISLNVGVDNHMLGVVYDNGSGGGSIAVEMRLNGVAIAGLDSILVNSAGTATIPSPGAEIPAGSTVDMVLSDAAGTISDGSALTPYGTVD